MKHPLPTQEVDPTRRMVSDHAVLGWVLNGLGVAGPDLTSTPRFDDADWHNVIALVFAHRLANLIRPGLETADLRIPVEVEAELTRFRTLANRMNAANLLSMRRILPRFDAAGVPVLVFKGPVVQQLAYGDLFVRPSSDIDLLVHHADFDRSQPLLEAEGYQLSPECRSIWWRAGLGEQHFEGADATAATVDLHHRVQQPGCPLPKDLTALMDQRVSVMVGGQTVPTLSLVHSSLLAAMSFVKALHHREPAVRYAVDFIALGLRQPPGFWDALMGEARRQGLANTVILTLRAGHTLFPRKLTLPKPDRMVLKDVDDAVFWSMIVHPETEGLNWPRRRDLLLALYDQKRDYPLGFGLMAGSELLRQAARGWPRAAQPA